MFLAIIDQKINLQHDSFIKLTSKKNKIEYKKKALNNVHEWDKGRSK